MAHKVTPTQELLEFAQDNGWTVNEFLPDRYSACVSKETEDGVLIVAQETSTRRWMWTLDRGRNWGKGNRSGHADSLTAAAYTAGAVAATESATLV